MKYNPLKSISVFSIRSIVVLAVLITGAAFFYSLQPAHAATTYTVNSLADTDDGACTVALCTLRDAINAAESNAGADTINFSVTGTITLTGGTLPTITDDLTINGPGATLLTVSGNNSVQVFNVNAAGTVTFAQLTISNGSAAYGQNGGGINFSGTGSVNVNNCTLSGNSTTGGYEGGAIYNQGTLNVTNSVLSNNSSGGSGSGSGGAIANYGASTIDSSTISGNSAGSSSLGGGIVNFGTLDVVASTISNNSGASFGGGICNFGTTLNVTNSTLSNNLAGVGGGAIFTVGTANITSSTLTNNSAGSGGGGIYNGGTANLDSSIVALNTAGYSPDLFGVITSQGHNIIGDPTDSTFVPTTGDQVGVTAAQLNLGPLANNGGPTQTRALGAGSVAINTGDDAVTLPPLSLTTDQRGPGYARKSGTHVDVGAFEVQQANAPTNANQCKNGGWRNFDNPHPFKNQGDCIQFVNTGK